MNIQKLKEAIDELKQIFIEKEEKAKKLIVDEQAEDTLVELINFKEWIENEIEQLKQKILKEAEKEMPNFKGIIGKMLEFRVYNERTYYKLNKEIKEVNPEFLKEIKIFKVNEEKVKEFERENNALPLGILKEVKPKRLEVKLKKNEETETVLHTFEPMANGESR